MTVLYVLGAASLVLWTFVVVIGLLYTRPSEVEAGPESLEHGDESPALVNLMVNGWRLTRDAMVATLVDLGARKVITFERAGPNQTVIHVPPRRHTGLRPYEEIVLDQVTQLAHNGVVPAAALVRGESMPKIWPKFAKQVTADARAFGLSQPRWSKRMLVVLNLASLLPGVMAAVLFLNFTQDPEGDRPWGLGLIVGAVVWFNLFGIAAKRQAERDTSAGRAAAAQWLGYREYLVANEQFKNQPPAAVEIWNRHLAYATTFGVAQTVNRTLPLDTHNDRSAWSAFGGVWHRVRIRYPRRWRWGRSAARTAFQGLWRTAAGVAGLHYLLKYKNSGGHIDPNDAIPVFTVKSPDQFDWIYDVGLALAGLLLVVGVVYLFLAIAELISRRERIGEVLRIRTESGSYVAITDGQSTKTRAYRLYNVSGLYTIGEGSIVRIRVGRFLGYVAHWESLPTEESGYPTSDMRQERSDTM